MNIMERDLEYESNNLIEDGIKCKNYKVCDTILPRTWLFLQNNYLCLDCHSMFGTWDAGENSSLGKGKGALETYNNMECPICLEIKETISQPRCNHSVCINCFKRCYYGDGNEPIFPYPDIEDEYDSDPDNSKWHIDYPLIKKYQDAMDEKYEKYENEDYLRKCPICRK